MLIMILKIWIGFFVFLCGVSAGMHIADRRTDCERPK